MAQRYYVCYLDFPGYPNPNNKQRIGAIYWRPGEEHPTDALPPTVRTYRTLPANNFLDAVAQFQAILRTEGG